MHTQDNRYRYKALYVGTAKDARRLGFDTQAYGPVDNNLSAGGLTWRINVFGKDWHEPAERYRQWLWQAYDLKAEQSRRAPWVRDVRLAVSWCPTDEAVLDALAEKLDPKTVLLHIPNWRTDPYDENYPTYVASDKAKAFIGKGRALGFHMMPHFNSIDMDPSHPAYAYVRDFQYRGIERHDLRGWSWYQGRGLGVPESNAARLTNRDKKVMIKVHPGLSMWRSILGLAILAAARDLAVDTTFIDVTLVTHNLHNCFVEAATPTEGMRKLIHHVATLGQGLVVGGEGLNEITMQGQSFGQAHLFKSWHQSIDGLERHGWLRPQCLPLRGSLPDFRLRQPGWTECRPGTAYADASGARCHPHGDHSFGPGDPFPQCGGPSNAGPGEGLTFGVHRCRSLGQYHAFRIGPVDEGRSIAKNRITAEDIVP